MNALIFEWDAFGDKDLRNAFHKQGIQYDTVYYKFKNTADKDNNEEARSLIQRKLDDNSFDFVFSMNYFPIIGEECYKRGIKYISWTYDSPLNVMNPERTLGLETNYPFFFDKLQVQLYKNLGIERVYHLPLAVDTAKLQYLDITKAERLKYACDVSFVGGLYPSNYDKLISPLDDYLKGFMDGATDAQSIVYGTYFIPDIITQELTDAIQNEFNSINYMDGFQTSKEMLAFAIATRIAHRERLTLIGLLSKRYDFHMYSKYKHDAVPHAKYCGTVDYNTGMPKVFKCSKINLNITRRDSASAIPLRCLDIMGSNSFLLSNYQCELDEFFQEGVHMAMYSSYEEALDKVEYYLAHDDLRERIAKNAFNEIKQNFSYKVQLGKIWKIAGLDI